MDKRWQHRLAAALAGISLALGAALLAPSAAQASDATYHCQSVTFDPGGAITPLFASGCTGPATWSAPGTVRAVPGGTLYHCQVLEATSYPEGLFVSGVVCEEF